MKKILILTVLTVMALSLIPSCTADVPSIDANTETREAAVSGAAQGAPADTSLPDNIAEICSDAIAVLAESDLELFLVREHDGRIGVFAENGADPLYVVDVFVFTLPRDVQVLLRLGIECDLETLELFCDAVTS